MLVQHRHGAKAGQRARHGGQCDILLQRVFFKAGVVQDDVAGVAADLILDRRRIMGRCHAGFQRFLRVGRVETHQPHDVLVPARQAQELRHVGRNLRARLAHRRMVGAQRGCQRVFGDRKRRREQHLQAQRMRDRGVGRQGRRVGRFFFAAKETGKNAHGCTG
ncbi:hypothetical protein D3C71_1637500 [compost metagenome]